MVLMCLSALDLVICKKAYGKSRTAPFMESCSDLKYGVNKVFKPLRPETVINTRLDPSFKGMRDIVGWQAVIYFKLVSTNLLFRSSVYEFSFQGDSNTSPISPQTPGSISY